MSIENQISMFSESGKIVHKIWKNSEWCDLNVSAGVVASGMEEYNAGLHVFEVPAGVTQLTVSGTAAGAGGHSGYNSANQRAGWGGGAGEWVKDKVITVTPGEHIAISVGTGGEGGHRAWIAGQPGEKTVIGEYLVLRGGNDNHSGGAYNGGAMLRNASGQVGGPSTPSGDINTGAGGGSTVLSDYNNKRLTGGTGGANTDMNTDGGAGGTVSSTYGAGGSGGGAGYGGNGGSGGNCDGSQAANSYERRYTYDGNNAAGAGAGGGGGASYGRSNYAWGYGGRGGDGYVKISWTV